MKEPRAARSGSWTAAATYVIACYAITWLACGLLRDSAARGHASALWIFLFVTVWSPTIVAIATAIGFGGMSGGRRLFAYLSLRRGGRWRWYGIALVLPVVAVAIAVAVARAMGPAMPFIPRAALPITLALQLITGATGEELGWRGLLLSQLQMKFDKRTSALVMSTLWSLWHLPSFFFPGLPQPLLPPLAFLLTVAAFGVFLSLLFNATNKEIPCTMLAHFSFNSALALGGARFAAVLWWALACVFGVVAIASSAMLGPSRRLVRGTDNNVSC